MESDSTYPAFPVFAIFGTALILIPLPWHLQVWNTGTCLFMIWTAVACLNLGINAIVWHGNAINSAPVWCDISSRIIVAGGVAIPSASLCIQRRLYNIVTMKSVNLSQNEKLKAICVDFAIGLGIPILQIVCQYIVSGHQFDIYEDIGCYPYTYYTPLAYPLSIVWPLVISLISAIYSVLTFRAFLRRRIEFTAYFASNSSITANRYFRLMALASIELLCTVPISTYGMYLNLTAAPTYPWISWSDTHFNYSKVEQIPAIIWRANQNSVISFELSRWAAPFCAFVFFGFFGFAEEARSNYRKAFACLAKVFCRWLPKRRLNDSPWSSKLAEMRPAGSLPLFHARPPRLPPHNPTASTVGSVDDCTLSGSPLDEKSMLDLSAIDSAHPIVVSPGLAV